MSPRRQPDLLRMSLTYVETIGQSVVARPQGPEVALDHMQDLIQDCMDHLRYSNARHFVFDMAGVSFLASACLGAMLDLLQQVEHVRGRIVLVHCDEHVLRLVRLTRLDSAFNLYEDLEQALA